MSGSKIFKYQIRGICFRSRTSIHITCMFRYKNQFWLIKCWINEFELQKEHTIVVCSLQWSFISIDVFVLARFPFPSGTVRCFQYSTLRGSLAPINITCTIISIRNSFHSPNNCSMSYEREHTIIFLFL
jgi:hypothetical protein